MNSTILESSRHPRSVGALLGHRAASASTSVPQSCCGCDLPVALAVPAKVAGFRRTKETTYVPSPAVGRAGRVAPATVASPLDGLGRHIDAFIGTGPLGRLVAQSVTTSRQIRIASEVAFPRIPPSSPAKAEVDLEARQPPNATCRPRAVCYALRMLTRRRLGGMLAVLLVSKRETRGTVVRRDVTR